MAESEEELKSLLINVKEESEKAGLKLNIQKIKIMASSPTTSWQTDGGKVERVSDFIFLGSKINEDSDCNHEINRCLLPGRKATTNLDSILKSRYHFGDKGPYSQSYGFSNSHAVDVRVGAWWRLSAEELMLSNVMLEKTIESPLDSKEIKLVNPKGNQPWIFTGRTDAEAEAPVLWLIDGKSQLIGKDSDAGKNWG